MPASRSLIALLIGTVAFFALWLVALKPGGSSSNGSSSSQGLAQYQSAINKARQAVQASKASNAASGNDGTSARASSTAASGGTAASSSTSSSSTTSSHAAKKPVVRLTPKVAAKSHAAMARLSTVQRALAAHKVLVMLFYNPNGTDDQAVNRALAAVPTLRGQVVKLSIPLSESANFTPVTQQVPVNFSPTVVLISRNGQTQELTGLIDRFVIAQRVLAAH